MKRTSKTVTPILQKCAKLPDDGKLVSKLSKYGVVFETREDPIISIPKVIPTTAKIPRSFFSRHVVEVARDLLGKTLNFGEFKGIITETEAYAGLEDEASHAFKGPTPR